MLVLALLARGALFLSPTLAPVKERRFGGVHSHLPYRQRLDNFQNVQYHGSLRVGGQTLTKGIFDTGSFDLLVISDRCESCKEQPYSENASKTFRPSTRAKPVHHSFGSGPTLSLRGYDVVEVGPLAALNQSVYQVVDHNISVLDSASFDAIVGIGRAGDQGELSLLESLNVSGFSICLERASLAPGWLEWGATRPRGSVEVEVVGHHHWAVSMSGFLPDVHLTEEQRGAAGLLLCGQGCGAILDSGTSLITAPGHALAALEMLLPPLQENCSNLHELPSLNLTLDGHLIVLPPEAYVLRLKGTAVDAKDAWDFLYFKPKILAMDQCFYAFMQMDQRTQYGPLWILGMPFFRYIHVTFAPAERRVFLAEASADCSPEPLETQPAPRSEKDDHPFPDMVVAQRSRRDRQPLEVDARSLLPPRGFPTARVL